ncbi:MAG: SPOR domain-containing protein [Candidatus Odinarchaeia archaeon]
MSEEINDLITKIKGGITLTNVRIGLFDIQGNILYSNLGEKAADIASKLTKGAFEAWDIGDYQVKKLERGCLLVSRVTEKLALALDSYEREGLVIVAMGALMKKYANEFNKIDSMLPGKPVPVKTAPVETAETTSVAPPPQPQTESPVEQATAAPAAEQKPPSTPTEMKFIDIQPDTILRVSQTNVGKIEMDPVMLSLVRVIDGVRPVKEITKLAGIDMNEAMPKLIYLAQQNVVKLVSNPEEDNIEYQFVYELVPPYTVDNVSMKACAGRSDEVVTVMTNLDRGYTVKQLSIGLKKVGFNKEPADVLEILKFYEGRNIVKLKKVGPGDPEPAWLQNPEYQVVYVYREGMNFEEVVKKLVIADRKTTVILRNLDLRLSVLWITMGMRGMGIDITPDKTLEILRELENRGIVRKL